MYKPEGRHRRDLRSDLTNHSPSFGNLSAKSPHSQHVVPQSRKQNVLREYNHLFKRKETVQLKHKWETDDEDGAADVTGSSSGLDADAVEGEHNGGEGSAEDEDRERHRVLNIPTKKGTSEEMTTPTASVTRHVQKPDHKNIIVGKRANVRTSEKRFSKPTNLSVSPSKNQQQTSGRQQQAQANQQHLFSQHRASKKPLSVPQQQVPQQAENRSKVQSRNQKTGDFYTKSVPSLGTEPPKTKEVVSSVTSNDMADAKSKLLKDASLALAMTLSPKANQKAVNMAPTKKALGPQYTSSSKFDRTY